MNRIDAMFGAAAKTGRTALIPYIACGHPSPAATVSVMHALVAAGADLIELGMPFSDPMADGPVIQRACDVAIEQGVTLKHVLSTVRAFRDTDPRTPVILMGYMNPIERLGVTNFAERCAAAGVDGALIVDLPPEESGELRQAFARAQLHQILLVAPTSPAARVATICKGAGGFVYYVALKGITGAASLAPSDVAAAIAGLRDLCTVPVGVGFGIKNASDAVAVGGSADAVVIGSALVSALDEAGPDGAAAAAKRFLAPIREALDRADESQQASVA